LSGDGEKLDVRELEMRNRELREHVRQLEIMSNFN
jgi:hypothetical protein